MQTTGIPRFNFIEHRENHKHSEHMYFVTTDVHEAVAHYLQRIQEGKPIYMTISSVDGKVCLAESHGLDSDHAKPRIIAKAQINDRYYKAFTCEFMSVFAHHYARTNR
ncbi:hypothetical protein M3N64_02415 [Sporolactobacillus sp. CPB3-1]|uniref:Uncharacterized protein n=1 Tax=Sporolactobacillus mangiferae TaxID=2940498 RepID=A0ABT0M7G2_9BACL|nr:hypothetical protein [Sporolactobacillus mangiferae]MCL1630796.1 hypothetical protein [Sporolactobacillus mangiferae]